MSNHIYKAWYSCPEDDHDHDKLIVDFDDQGYARIMDTAQGKLVRAVDQPDFVRITVEHNQSIVGVLPATDWTVMLPALDHGEQQATVLGWAVRQSGITDPIVYMPGIKTIVTYPAQQHLGLISPDLSQP